MKTFECLEFRLKINNLMKQKFFDQIFDEADSQFFQDFSIFIRSIVGKKWLTKPEGKLFTYWQNG